jgi:hypothetical protein
MPNRWNLTTFCMKRRIPTIKVTINIASHLYLTVIYDIDEPVDKIYMIRSGKAIVETLIEINEENVYPIVRFLNIHQFNRVHENGKRGSSKRRFFTRSAHFSLERYSDMKSS